MLTFYGVSFVMYFIKILSGSRNSKTNHATLLNMLKSLWPSTVSFLDCANRELNRMIQTCTNSFLHVLGLLIIIYLSLKVGHSRIITVLSSFGVTMVSNWEFS